MGLGSAYWFSIGYAIGYADALDGKDYDDRMPSSKCTEEERARRIAEFAEELRETKEE